VHNKFKGSVVPPTTGALESELVALDVASTLKDTARRVMGRSAEQANFFEAGRDRLVMPRFTPGPETKDGDEKKNQTGNGDGNGTGVDLDPLLVAMTKKTPPTGNDWPGPPTGAPVLHLRDERLAELRRREPAGGR